MKLKSIKKEIIMLLLIITIQTIIFIIAGINKSYIHMDEAYSLGLASYDKTEIQANDNFYNTWHSKEYYEDYLAVNEDEKYHFSQVYDNQKNDVHPPFYYFILRIAMGFHIGSYSKWPGIIVNIIIYAWITILMYLIIKKLLEGKNKCKEKSAILAMASSITLLAITNVIYIRMYALSTLNIVITTYLHLTLLDKNKSTTKLLLAIGISALIGSLTHYYYLFYLAMMGILFTIKYIKEKEYKELSKYIVTMLISGIISFIIFPYSIQHMFLGYRGQGAISNLTNIAKFANSISQYILRIHVYGFHNLLFIIFAIILGVILYKKINKMKLIENKSPYFNYIFFPTLCYFILVAVSSPWVELRYVMPIGGFIFVLTIYLLNELFANMVKETTCNNMIISIILLMFIMPWISNSAIDLMIGKDFRNEQETFYSSKTELAKKLKSELNLPINLFSAFSDASIDNILLFIKDFKIEPEVLYSNKHTMIEMLKNEFNVPTLYLLNSNNNRFLDDILLFANINESYIAKDIECDEQNIQQIMLEKNIENGIVIFINDGQENDNMLNIIKDTLKLENITYLKRLNACDVYLIK